MHWPGVAEQATAVFDNPVAAASVKIAPVTLLGPLLVTRTVYTVEVPANTLETPSVFVIDRSAVVPHVSEKLMPVGLVVLLTATS